MHLPRRRRLLLMILLCETALFVLTYQPDFITSSYFPARPVAPSVPRLLPEEGIALLEKFSFDSPADLEGWEEKSFNGRTEYRVVREGERSFLRAASRNACSGLYRSVQVNVTSDLFVDWSWRAHTFPDKKAPPRFDDRKQDDFAARIYLVFPGTNFFKSDVIEYLWDGDAKKGVVAVSPYSDRIKMLVVDSGKPEAEEWRTNRRNILEDYRLLFGKDPQKALGILAVMSDSDNTGSSSGADFGPIRLYRKTS